MARFDSIDLDNVLSHKHTRVIWPGRRVQVKGKNGAGKTSASVDGLLWVLYGTSRGGTIDSMKGPWDTNMRGVVRFEVGGKDYRVIRDTSKKPSLEIYNDSDNIDMTEKHVAMNQKTIIDLIGSENAFTNTVIFKQGDGLRFAIMTASERMALIDELVGIKEYAAIESASNKQGRAAEVQRAKSEQQVETVLEARAGAEQAKLVLKDLEKDLKPLQSQLRDAEAAIKNADSKLDEAQESYKKIAEIETELRNAASSFNRAESNLSAAETALRRTNEELDALENGKPCPTCGTELNPSHPHIIKQIESLRTRCSSQGLQRDSLSEDVDKAKERLHDAQRAQSAADAQIRKSYEDAKRLKDHASAQFGAARNALVSKEAEKNRIAGSIAVLESDLDKLPDYQDAMDRYAKDVKAYALISEAFSKRGIPRELKRGFVAEMEKYANQLVSTLGNYAIRLSLEKDGVERHGIVEGTMDVWVTDALGERKLEMFSGGQKQRLSVALRLAMAMTMAKRNDRPLRTLIIDEALDGLDPEGKDAVLTMLGSINAFDRMIFITHDPAISGLFPDSVEFAQLNGLESVLV